MTFIVVKRNKRLHIVRDDGTSIYTPPNFLRLPNREVLWAVARELTAGREYIEAIMDFEAMHRP